MKKIFFLFFFFSLKIISYEIDTLYGSCTIEERILIDLIECRSMQRLKDIHQYGVSYFISDMKPYSRFEHSLGVFFIVKKFGGSLHEQIAALLHDVSHTVFSHVGDHVFKHYCHKNSYQDNIHQWFLEQTEIPEILAKYNITIEDIDHKNGLFSMLEADLPQLCADRIEYILYGGYCEDQLNKEEIKKIIDALHWQNGTWFFDSCDAAKKFALSSLYLTKNVFSTPWNFVVYHWAAKALRRAVKINLISLDDIHFSTDPGIWNLLRGSEDQKIKLLVQKLQNAEEHYCVVDKNEQYNFFITPKCRGVDPFILTKEGGLALLSQLDKHYAELLNQMKNSLQMGLYLKYL